MRLATSPAQNARDLAASGDERPATILSRARHPGVGPTWTSSAKDMVTTALGPSRVWATIGYGILNEVYWPWTGEPQLRDLGFIVADANTWQEVKRVRNYMIETPLPYVPIGIITHVGDDYVLELRVVPDPRRDALLIDYRLHGAGKRLYVLLAPHLGGTGYAQQCPRRRRARGLARSRGDVRDGRRRLRALERGLRRHVRRLAGLRSQRRA